MKRFSLTVVALCLAAGAIATAGEKRHAVRGGESASSIARKYYGRAELGDFLLRYNGKSGTVIRAGEDLRIPWCDVHRVQSGDSWSVLAKTYLGRPGVHPVIAALNGYEKRGVLQVGDTIVMPVVLPHALERGETLASLAERFLGDTQLADLLREFNEIEDPRRLSIGETVEIPLVTVRLREIPPGDDETRPIATVAEKAKPEVRAPDLPAPPSPALEPPAYRPPPRIFEPEIRKAGLAFEDGNYESARTILESLRDRTRSEGSDAERAEVLRLLAFVYVAFDMEPEACGALESMAGLEEEADFDPDLVSPKIRDVLFRCGA